MDTGEELFTLNGWTLSVKEIYMDTNWYYATHKQLGLHSISPFHDNNGLCFTNNVDPEFIKQANLYLRLTK